MRKKALILFLFIVVASCKKEEKLVSEPTRDVGEQAIVDNNAIIDYLRTHTYNYEVFQENNLPDYTSIKIDSISADNQEKIPLIDLVEKRQIDVRTIEGNVVPHTLYYLVTREGSGAHPAAVESTFVVYEGSLINGTVFDQIQTPIWFDLLRSIRGFREGMTVLKAGTYTVNTDNTVNYKDFGQGVFFIPSGMGYFSSSQGNIPAYSPLIFKVSLYTMNESDHDFDGILTKNEYDNDNDGIPDDSDEDGVPDYLDND